MLPVIIVVFVGDVSHRHSESLSISQIPKLQRFPKAPNRDQIKSQQKQPHSQKPHKNAIRPPPPQRARRRHRTTHLRPHSHNPSPPHAQTRRAPQDLPANRRRALGRRIRLLRTTTSIPHLFRCKQTRATADLEPENHLHSPRPAPSTAQCSLLPELAAHDTCEVCAFRDAQSERLGERCG
jgi:hypothetical protein